MKTSIRTRRHPVFAKSVTIVSACLGLVLSALFQPVTAAPEAAPRNCRVLFLGGSEKDPETLQLHDGTACQEIELPRMNFSKIYRIPSGPLTLRLLATPPAGGQAIPDSAPQAAVPESTQDFYLLVTQDPANKTLPLRMQVIDATAERFKPGQLLWYNLTGNDVAGQVGIRKLAIKARSRTIMDPPASAAGSYPVDLTFRIPGKEAVYPLCETSWTHDPVARTVFFIISEPGSRTPRVLGFPDRPLDPAPNP